MLHFSDKIKILGINPYVSLPIEVLEAIFVQAHKTTSPIPVKGTVNGTKFKQTLVRYQGEWRLYINGMMLQNAGIKFKAGEIIKVEGTKVNVTIEYDPTTREIPMHKKFKAALSVDELARKSFEELSNSRKQEILRYLHSLKTEASINKNIERILQHLRGEESDALYPLMHRKNPKLGNL